MLEQTPITRGIANLYPWAFLPNPGSTAPYYSAVAGRKVIPFAQAIGYDLIACFLAEPASEPGVVVLNPWSEVGAAQTQAVLPNYDAWLVYAQDISERIQAREKEESAGDEDE